MDHRQAEFAEFEVPDRARISKVHRWLARHGHLEATAGRPRRVLEIGYARGGLLDLLPAGDAFERFAVDLHARRVDPSITFFRHDCNEPFAFADGRTFDVVFAGEIIEHIFDDRQFVEHVRDVLAPGGIFALTTPNLFFLVNRVVMPLGRMPYFAYEPYHYHVYSRRTLTGLIRQAGLEVRGVTSSHVLISSRRSRLLGGLCEKLGDVFPSLGAHLIVFAQRRAQGSQA